jgi:hypothetical protein
MRKVVVTITLVFVVGVCWLSVTSGQQTATDGPNYTSRGQLVRPENYREWVYVTSGLGMTYGPAEGATGARPNFDNVFVNRESYRQFLTNGKWPERTIFILEIRRGEDHISINNGGQTQGDLIAIEAAVKDSARYPDTTWAYFTFGGAPNLAAAATALPTSASCYPCHRNNTAVEQTFVQFYPTLFEVAKRMGTVKSSYESSPAKH